MGKLYMMQHIQASRSTRRHSSVLRLLVTASLVAGIALAAISAPPVHAATITVTTTIDEVNDDGDCSLREAQTAANTDEVVDACPAGSGADSISLPAGTYALTVSGNGTTAGDLDITDDTTLIGAGPANTI